MCDFSKLLIYLTIFNIIWANLYAKFNCNTAIFLLSFYLRGVCMLKRIFIIAFVCLFTLNFSSASAYNLSNREDIFTPAFQLLWKDLISLISVKKVNFVGLDPKVAKTLNSCPFAVSDINTDSIYKIVAPKSYELKAKIQREIFDKFGESSKVLDDIDWTPRNVDEYILYALLKKNIKFPTEFDILESRPFNNSKEMYKYFGVLNSAKKYSKQVKPLFYEYSWDYAVSLQTESGDKVILYRTNSPENVYDLYAQIGKKSVRPLSFGSSDKLIVPFISLNERIEYNQLCDRKIYDTKYVIAKAIEDVEFKLDNTGAQLRNEAVIEAVEMSMPIPGRGVVYDFSKPFVIYLVGKDKSLPYFALRVNDTKFLVK